MRTRIQVTLFPFLSVLVSTMGVLSFLAVTFLLFVRQDQPPPDAAKQVEVQWVGAPAHVSPLLVECRKESVVFHLAPGRSLRFSREELAAEVEIVKGIERKSIARLGAAPDSYRRWLFMKDAIQNDPRLAKSFTGEVHRLELYNLSGEGRRTFKQQYPILLVFPDGIPTYQLVSFLVETTTRLSVGLEPMLKGWSLPYQEHAS